VAAVTTGARHTDDGPRPDYIFATVCVSSFYAYVTLGVEGITFPVFSSASASVRPAENLVNTVSQEPIKEISHQFWSQTYLC